MDFKNVNYSEIEKNTYLNLLNILNLCFDKASSFNDKEILFFKNTIADFMKSLTVGVNTVYKFSHPVERLVINRTVTEGNLNSRLKSLEQLRYPPLEIADKLDYNRASLKGQSIFYAGTLGQLPNTIENPPKVGDLITTSKWTLKQGEKLNLMIICQDKELADKIPNELLNGYNSYVDSLKKLPNNTREVVEQSYKFLIKAFTSKVSKNNKQGYFFSSVIADMLFNKMEGKQIDAIYYPSVANDGSAMNIAIKPDVLDEKFTMIEAIEQIVTVDPESSKVKETSGWFGYTTADCKSFDPESLILNWFDKQYEYYDNLDKVIKKYNIILK